MKFSVNWLKQWVDIDLDANDLAVSLTAGGLEVDGIEPVAAPFSGVVVGRIVSCEQHPDADKLKVCSVDDGGAEPVQVVCGAPNAREGLVMPFARVGAVIGDDFKIKKAKLRGVESQGMCCSARELGLSDDHSGLMELPADATLGMDVREFLTLDDHSIDLDLTPNRADCLGIRGLSQDVAAICDARYTPLEIHSVAAEIEDSVPVSLHAPEACPKYAGRVIRDVDCTAATPLWMVEALRRCGIRSISAVVDITNYVMLELGQPMHAFDLDTLSGGISVRYGNGQERLVLLDEKDIEVHERLLAICDETGPVALGGVMGGLKTGVSDTTRNVFLECAWFEPSAISGKARSLGLHSDAAHRFERGADPQGQVNAIERMTSLMMEITGGQPGPVDVAQNDQHMPAVKPVTLRHARLNRILGIDLPFDEVTAMFTRLGMDVETSDEGWSVTAPSIRFDIEIEEDLVEEVARIHGYDALPAHLPGGELSLAVISEKHVALTRIREALAGMGYQEAINYSFVDQELLDKIGMGENALPLANPISSDMDVMRTSLLPGLLTSLSRNLRRQQQRVRLFESGVAFVQGEKLEEIPRLAGVVCGALRPEQWGDKSRPVDFFDCKQDVERLLQLRGDESAVFSASELSWLHPGQGADISISGTPVGWIGQMHPAVLKRLEIKAPVFAFELDLEGIQIREKPNAKNISRFPSVRRDLAFLLPEAVTYEEVKACVENITGEILQDLLIFDVFSGQSVEKGYKSLAIGLILQDVSCTLIDKDVNPLTEQVIEALHSHLGAQHRG